MFAWNLIKTGATSLMATSKSSLSTLTMLKPLEMTSGKLWPSLSANGLLNKQVQLPQTNQVRNWGYNDRMTLKDIKRREILRRFAPERVRLQTLKANHVLPKTIKVTTSCDRRYLFTSC